MSNGTAMELWACGARGSFVTAGARFARFGHNTSCFALRVGCHGVIVDCGTGLAAAEKILSGCKRIDVLFTHFHYDHVLGLLCAPWLLKSESDVHMWGCAAGGSLQGALCALSKPPYWPVPLHLEGCTLHDILPGDALTLGEGVSARTMAANHPDGGVLYRVSAEGKSVAFAFDHEHGASDGELAAFAKDCDIIVYDGMFSAEEYEKYKGWGHSSCEQGLLMAESAGAKGLLITHHAPWHTDEELEKMEQTAQRRCPNCSFAREGACYRP